MRHPGQLKFCIRPAGEGALCLTLKGPLDEEKNIRIMALKGLLEREGERMGLGEAIPGFVSLLVRYDALRMDYEEAYRALERLAGESFGEGRFRGGASGAAAAPIAGAGAEKGAASSGEDPAAGRLVEIPVCYGGDFGEDLGFVAAPGNLTEEEVIRIHSGRDYRIYMLGFLPGFPYLGGLHGTFSRGFSRRSFSSLAMSISPLNGSSFWVSAASSMVQSTAWQRRNSMCPLSLIHILIVKQ